jgi:hypothetical protein
MSRATLPIPPRHSSNVSSSPTRSSHTSSSRRRDASSCRKREHLLFPLGICRKISPPQTNSTLVLEESQMMNFGEKQNYRRLEIRVRYYLRKEANRIDFQRQEGR